MRSGILAALVAATALFSLTSATAETAIGSDSNLPVPRYVSLRTEGANGRHGPGLEHRVDWIYERAGLPLMVTGESGPWRRVRDPDGKVIGRFNSIWRQEAPGRWRVVFDKGSPPEPEDLR